MAPISCHIKLFDSFPLEKKTNLMTSYLLKFIQLFGWILRGHKERHKKTYTSPKNIILPYQSGKTTKLRGKL